MTRFEEAPAPAGAKLPPALEIDPYAVPSSPPPEVLDALDRAARVLNELGRENVTIWLDAPGAALPRVLLLHDGGPVQELSHRALLNLLDGDTGIATAACT